MISLRLILFFILILLVSHGEIYAKTPYKKASTSASLEKESFIEKNINQGEIYFYSPIVFLSNQIKADEDYEESAIKRGEILFFLSIPFVALSYFLVISATYYLGTNDNTFSLPTESIVFASISTVAISIGIIYIDIKKNTTTHKINLNHITDHSIRFFGRGKF